MVPVADAGIYDFEFDFAVVVADALKENGKRYGIPAVTQQFCKGSATRLWTLTVRTSSIKHSTTTRHGIRLKKTFKCRLKESLR